MNEDRPHAETEEQNTDGTFDGQYAMFPLEDDGVVLYDRDNAEAWIQSEGATSLEEAQ